MGNSGNILKMNMLVCNFKKVFLQNKVDFRQVDIHTKCVGKKNGSN